MQWIRTHFYLGRHVRFYKARGGVELGVLPHVRNNNSRKP